MDFNLTDEEIKFLKAFHKKVKDRKIADKVKCVVALAQGFSFEDIANILLIDERTARRYFDTYKKDKIMGVPETQRSIYSCWTNYDILY